jgi:hypothetical protein
MACALSHLDRVRRMWNVSQSKKTESFRDDRENYPGVYIPNRLTWKH